MRYHVYKITNLVNGKVYVGKTNNLRRRWSEHVTSSRSETPRQVVAKAIRKYGVESFLFEPLQEYVSDAEALRGETFWITQLKSDKTATGYNLDGGGLGGKILTTETRLKIALAHIGMKASAETKTRLSLAHKGKKRTLESIEKTASALRGRARPKDVVERASSARKWVGHSKESRAKMSAAQVGKSHTPQHNANIGAAHRGMKRSPEAIARMTAAQRLRREKEGL